MNPEEPAETPTAAGPFGRPAAATGVAPKPTIPKLVLSGFMDRPQLEQVLGPYLAACDAERAKEFWALHTQSQVARRALPTEDLSAGILTDLSPELRERADALLRLPAITDSFRGQTLHAAEIELGRLVCQQPLVGVDDYRLAKGGPDLFEYCLPLPRRLPSEVSLSMDPPPTGGPFRTGRALFVSDVPQLTWLGVAVERDRVSFFPPSPVNLLQVVEFQGRYYLRNGYHRVRALLAAGVGRAPGVIVSGILPDHQMKGPGFFELDFLVQQARPPLMNDFAGPCAVRIDVPDLRYGVLLDFEISQVGVSR